MGKLVAILTIAVLVAAIAACSGMEMIDHKDPVKPQIIDTELVQRIKHRNGIWYKQVAVN